MPKISTSLHLLIVWMFIAFERSSHQKHPKVSKCCNWKSHGPIKWGWGCQGHSSQDLLKGPFYDHKYMGQLSVCKSFITSYFLCIIYNSVSEHYLSFNDKVCGLWVSILCDQWPSKCSRGGGEEAGKCLLFVALILICSRVLAKAWMECFVN